jgi:predicted nucleic acid-binding protein
VIFVDSSFWIALRWPRDDRHEEAKTVLRRFADEPMLTTNLVRGETWTLLRRRVGHHAAVDFVSSVAASPRIELVRVDERAEDGAMSWLRRHDERSYSFVDATSFAVMRSRRIRSAFAFDLDFTAAGFVELRPS